jgi:hypothetical protein
MIGRVKSRKLIALGRIRLIVPRYPVLIHMNVLVDEIADDGASAYQHPIDSLESGCGWVRDRVDEGQDLPRALTRSGRA